MLPIAVDESVCTQPCVSGIIDVLRNMVSRLLSDYSILRLDKQMSLEKIPSLFSFLASQQSYSVVQIQA